MYVTCQVSGKADSPQFTRQQGHLTFERMTSPAVVPRCTCSILKVGTIRICTWLESAAAPPVARELCSALGGSCSRSFCHSSILRSKWTCVQILSYQPQGGMLARKLCCIPGTQAKAGAEAAQHSHSLHYSKSPLPTCPDTTEFP